MTYIGSGTASKVKITGDDFLGTVRLTGLYLLAVWFRCWQRIALRDGAHRRRTISERAAVGDLTLQPVPRRLRTVFLLPR